ncbi:beta-propeller fold lactonase family protein [Streptomyces sp. NPDC047049]|uniref:beta-propeller fold lactonase family protein n=1 Tax=Streptomyces sp. NPDC047049 TaxID=3156688 RepID=UPI00340F82DF
MSPAVQRILAVDWAADTLVLARLEADGTVVEVESASVPGNPRTVSADGAGEEAYVATAGVPAFSVVEVRSAGAGTRKELGAAPYAVVAGLDGNRVCLADWAGAKVYVHTPPSGTPVPVPVSAGPFALAAAPGKDLVCVVHDGNATAARQLKIVKVGDGATPTGVQLPGEARALVVNPAGTHAYVGCRGVVSSNDGTLAVVRLSDGTVAAEPRVGREPAAVAISPAGDRLCVADNGTASLSVAQLSNGLPGTFLTLPVARRPHAVAFSPDGNLIYVLSRTTGGLSAVHVGLIGGKLKGVCREVPTLGAAVPSSVVFSPDGAVAHVTDQAAGVLIPVRVGPSVLQEVGTGAGSRPSSVSVTPDGSRVVCADSAANRVLVSEVSGASAGTPGPIALPGDTGKIKPWGVATGKPSDKPAFAVVTSPPTDECFAIIPEEGQTLSGEVTVKPVALPSAAAPRGVTVTSDGRYALTANSGGESLSRIDLQGGAATIPASEVQCNQPVGVEIGGTNGDTLYVADYDGKGGKGHVSVLKRQATGWKWHSDITAESDKLQGAHELALSPDGKYLYVASYLNSRIAIFLWDSGTASWKWQASPAISGLTNPYGLALSSDGNYLYASSKETKRVAQLSVQDGTGLTRTAWYKIDATAKSAASLTLSAKGYLYASDEVDGYVYGIKIPDQGGTYDMQRLTGKLPLLKPAAGIVNRGDKLYVVTLSDNGTGKEKALTELTIDPDDPLKITASTEPKPPLTEEPYGIAARADGPLYITNQTARTISVRGDTLVTTVDLSTASDSEPREVACNAHHAVITDAARQKPVIHHLPLDTLTPSTPLTASAPSTGLAISPDGTRAYAAHPTTNSLTVLDLSAAPKILEQWTELAAPDRLTVSPDGKDVYATSLQGDRLQIIDAATGVVRCTTAPGTSLAGHAAPPRNGAAARLYVTDSTAERFLVLDTGTHTPGTPKPAGTDVRQAIRTTTQESS